LKAKFLKRPGRKKLLVFFLGWGMDETPFLELIPREWDILFLYDFSTWSPFAIPEGYAEIKVLAWSFGVTAALSLKDLNFPLLCVAGTGAFYHSRLGIPPRIFDATLEALKKAPQKTLFSFYRNMFSEQKDLVRFLKRRPQRPFSSLVEELEALKERNFPPNARASVVITLHDRIISARNQKRFWAERARLSEVPLGHFPFYQFRDLEDFWNKNFRGVARAFQNLS